MYEVTRRAMPDVVNINYDILFSEKNIHYPMAYLEKLIYEIERSDLSKEKQELTMNFMDELADEKPNLIEKYPVDYYRKGIGSIQCILYLHQKLAYEHLMGNNSLSLFQLVEKMIHDTIGDEIITELINVIPQH